MAGSWVASPSVSSRCTSLTEDKLDILGILAQQAAVAIHKVHYVNELEELNRGLDEPNLGLLETLGTVSEFL
jgi:GAF domain-containing protein